MPRKNQVQKRNKSSKLSTLQKISGVGESTEQKFKEAQRKLRDFKREAKKRGVEVHLSIPRVNYFKSAEQVRQTIKNVNAYLKKPTVTRQGKDTEKLPYKLIEEERKLVKKLNRPLKNFQEKINERKITIGGVEQDETVKEYRGKARRTKDYTFSEQYRYLTEKELRERVKELKQKAKRNIHLERSKNAKESYIEAFKNEGLNSTEKGQKLLKKIERMSLKKFIDRLATELNVSFDFVYDENLEVEDRIDALDEAWR